MKWINPTIGLMRLQPKDAAKAAVFHPPPGAPERTFTNRRSRVKASTYGCENACSSLAVVGR